MLQKMHGNGIYIARGAVKGVIVKYQFTCV